MMSQITCEQAQQRYDDLAKGRVVEPLATALHQHLADCTDCRVARQRTDRLRQLLALKRHESPPPGYFDNFLAEFHRRQNAAPAPAWWERWLPTWELPALPALRYAVGTVAVALIGLGLFQHASLPRPVSHTEPVPAPAPQPILLADADLESPLSAAPAVPRYVLDRIAVTPVSYEAGSVRF